MIQTTHIDVDTGQYHVSSKAIVLQSVALGSCVALVVHEPKKKIGGIAHIMLPGSSPRAAKDTKFAKNAIETLLKETGHLGAEKSDLEISLVGGANVLREGDIPDKVIDSVLACLKNLDLEPSFMRVGGNERRSAFLEISTGRVSYTEGDDLEVRELSGLERI